MEGWGCWGPLFLSSPQFHEELLGTNFHCGQCSPFNLLDFMTHLDLPFKLLPYLPSCQDVREQSLL